MNDVRSVRWRGREARSAVANRALVNQRWRAGPDPGERAAGRDRGSATLWVLAVGILLVAGGMAGALVGAARTGSQQAGAAADLGALAGAARVIEGAEAACARAAQLVAVNGGRLTACTVDGLDLVVTVEVVVSPLQRTAVASARAGPVEDVTWEGGS
jgi:secretion/DNA translocation related TadE-like protein